MRISNVRIEYNSPFPTTSLAEDVALTKTKSPVPETLLETKYNPSCKSFNLVNPDSDKRMCEWSISHNFINQMNNRREFISKLMEVDVSSISSIPYCRNYLEHLIGHIDYYLDIYDGIFDIVKDKCNRTFSEINIVDYGCGNGLLGLYAVHCGFRRVILLDTDSNFIKAAEILAGKLNSACEIVKGDYESLVNRNDIDAIAGTDVIEHVHDLNAMMAAFKKINPALSIFSTASNPRNFFKVQKLQQQQKRDETAGSNPDDPDYGHLPFMEIRRSIIKSSLPGKPEKLINLLAKNTRGMVKDEITRAMYLYDREGVIPKPASGTNTCNPLTGSWTERILTIDEYLKIYKDAGFFLDLSAGFYNEHQKGLHGRMNFVLNRLINFSGITFAPYIILTGTLND